MPWDETELWTARLDLSGALPVAVEPHRVVGGDEVSIFQPAFTPDGQGLVYLSDESGLGQVYAAGLDGEEPRRLTDGAGEYSRPAWSQGQRALAFADSRTLVCVRADAGFHRLQRIDLGGGRAQDIAGDTGAYTVFDQPVGQNGKVAAIASASDQPSRVVSFDARTGAGRVWARSTGETLTPSTFSTPEPLTWRTGDGDEAHGLFYPPRNDAFESPGLPPLIVLVHGGPTSQVTSVFQPQTQFFTSRGYAVLQVNYRGSTGYGRDYMLKLRGNWGLHDVEDSRSGAQYLADQGKVDPRRRVIMGGSAGGYTVLQSLVVHPGFYTAALCLFGVSNQFTLASDTHKFEARYLDSMLGPLPEAAAIYRERSPIFFANKITDPIAVFQGDIDRVVPRAQSDEIVASLKARGVPHEYHVYQGEGHGWRKSETIESFYGSVDRFLRQYVVFA
jgi:dipeptidyl aminopeptidase/acylaminoacyl peptidase